MPQAKDIIEQFSGGAPSASAAVPDAAADAQLEHDASILEQLETGQIYLSRQEIFANDISDEAFVTSDGQDLRSQRGLQNLATAANLVNWQNSDAIVRVLWGMERTLVTKLAGIIDARDLDTLAALFDRLTRENPEQVKSIEEARRRYLSAPHDVMLGATPLNTYISAQTQVALRFAFVTAVARDVTASGFDLRDLWYAASRQKEPTLSRADFNARYNIDLSGVAGYVRGIGYKGNFFKGLARSVSKLFKRPADWFRSAFKEAGRYVQLHNLPFTWIRKIPMFGVGLAGIGSVFTDEIANAMISGKLSTFNEQRLVRTIGEVGQQVGMIMTLIGGILALTPLAPIGAVLVVVGGLLIVAGQAVLRLQAMVRQSRLDKEEYARRMRDLERLKKLRAQGNAETVDTSIAANPAQSSAAPALALAGLAALFFFR